jgi:dipeptidyl aminopeptidase/acylaminoacyl peptidase
MPAIPLIPRAALFGNPSRHQARISPDGKWLTWLAPFEGVLNVWLAPADDVGAAEPLTRVTGRPIAWQDWACDGAHILFLCDESGDENWRVFAINRTTGAIRNLTPILGISARILMVSPERPDTILVGLNDRDPKWHDVWVVDLATAERQLVLENSEEFWNFAFDWQLNPRVARKAEPAQGGSQLYRLADGTREPWLRIPHADELTTWPLFYDRAGNALTMMSSLGRNRAALIRVDENAGTQTLLAEHAKVDLGATRILNPKTFEIDAIAANYLRQEWIVLNPAVQSDLRFLRNNLNSVDFLVESQSNDNDRWIVTAYGPKQPLSYFLYDRRQQVLSSLFSARPELAGYRLAPMQSHVVKARDGLDLVSYLTLPAETQGSRPTEPLPMVLIVHGGPWGRDVYGYRPDHQWLANRGYAVLSVNYRASTGFGKDFTDAGTHEHAGKMHDDLIDAVEWAVREGIARRGKIAIMGTSYGGYATLVGLTFTPEFFCCGVSIVGISNLVTMLESMPPYWAGFNEFMFRSYADVRTEEGRAWLRSRSPLYKVNRICRPLLIGHGANDVRCKIQESDQIVRAMRDRHLAVTYVVYPDEGHGFARPENRMSFNAISEAFLAKQSGRPLPADRQGLCGIEPDDQRRNRGARKIAWTGRSDTPAKRKPPTHPLGCAIAHSRRKSGFRASYARAASASSTRLWQRRLHDETAGTGINDAQPAQSKQCQRLHPRPRLGRVVRSRGRERADQALDQRSDQRGGGERNVLLGEAPARVGIADEPVEFVDQRLPVGGTRGIDVGLDRLGNQREGQPPAGKGPRGERGDGGRQRRKRTGRGLRRTLQRGQFARGKRRH